jgi:uncharacterized membrane-anchored protein
MRAENVPTVGLRYWVAISLASIAGCNTGDLVAFILRAGHLAGLVPLAILLAALLWGEKIVSRPLQLWYWGAILVIRTAATNLADQLTHTLHLPYPWVFSGLELLQVLLVMAIPVTISAASPANQIRPATGFWYWAAMLSAGTLGTAIGDCVADDFVGGSGYATLWLAPLTLMVLLAGRRSGWSGKGSYWIGIVAVRAAGTTAGDYLTEPFGHKLGLDWATAISCTALVAMLWLWRPSANEAVAA